MRCPKCINTHDEYIHVVEEDTTSKQVIEPDIEKIEDPESDEIYINVDLGYLVGTIKNPTDISDFKTLALDFKNANDSIDEKFETLKTECPINVPSEYSANFQTYVKHYLSQKNKRHLREISNELAIDENLILTIILAQKQIENISAFNDTIKYYVSQRDQVIDRITNDEFAHLSTDLFSLLLLFTALCEELVSIILKAEIPREESRLACVTDSLVDDTGSNYKQHLNLLNNLDIISPEIYEKLNHLRRRRNNAVHDAAGRQDFDPDTTDEAKCLIRKMEESLNALLILSGRKAAHVICNYGPETYRSEKQSDAVDLAKSHWKVNHADAYQLLQESSYIDLNHIRWTPREFKPSEYQKCGGFYYIRSGADIDELNEREFAVLMDFVSTASGATRTVVNSDLHEANLSRQNFMLLSLLLSENEKVSTSEKIANRISSTPDYVCRKRLSLDWRTPRSDKKTTLC